MASRLCVSYEAVRNLKTEKKIADMIGQTTHNSGLTPNPRRLLSQKQLCGRKTGHPRRKSGHNCFGGY
jgi:hypothetical protein